MSTIRKSLTAGFLGLMALAIVAVPQVNAQNSIDFGTSYAEDIGLGTTDIRETIADIITAAMGLLGIVAVVIILFGGFKWMTSGGDSTKVEEARGLIINGIIGLVIILTSYSIAVFVINLLSSSTGANVSS